MSFTELYRTYSVAQLLEVIKNKDDYQQEAVNAAAAELASRNIPDEELLAAEKELIKIEQPKLERKRKQEEAEKKFQAVKNKIVTEVTPTENMSADKKIRLTAYGILLFYLYSLYQSWSSLKWFYKSNQVSFLFIFLVIMFVMVPVGVLFFWRKGKTGWVIICAWFAVNVTTALFVLIEERIAFSGSRYEYFSFIPRPDISYYLIPLLVWGGALVYINLPVMTKQFYISRTDRWSTIIASVALMTVILLVESSSF